MKEEEDDEVEKEEEEEEDEEEDEEEEDDDEEETEAGLFLSMRPTEIDKELIFIVYGVEGSRRRNQSYSESVLFKVQSTESRNEETKTQ